jgi:hypothetical protein
MRAVAETGRENEIALYTGNDDHIVLDLLTMYSFETEAGVKKVGMVGGLLGHWACWTHSAVELLNTCKQVRKTASIPATLITLAEQITDCNAAFFDVKNQFAGCIPGIHEVLRRQGLLDNVRCLNPEEKLSPGQSGDIDRVYRSYPHLNDDAFVTRHLADWLDG